MCRTNPEIKMLCAEAIQGADLTDVIPEDMDYDKIKEAMLAFAAHLDAEAKAEIAYRQRVRGEGRCETAEMLGVKCDCKGGK